MAVCLNGPSLIQYGVIHIFLSEEAHWVKRDPQLVVVKTMSISFVSTKSTVTVRIASVAIVDSKPIDGSITIPPGYR